MSTRIICAPITDDEQIGSSWGKAPAVAIATVDDGTIESWRTEAVSWNVSHDEGTPGSHHARVARFVQDNGITTVLAFHMGEPMRNMLTKLGVDVQQGVSGNARRAVASSQPSTA
jgi:predicted Fe-Mo cluster-binding NifX family protein